MAAWGVYWHYNVVSVHLFLSLSSSLLSPSSLPVCLSLSVNPGHVRVALYLTVPIIGVTYRRCKIKKRKLAKGWKTGLSLSLLFVCLSLIKERQTGRGRDDFLKKK